MFFQKADTPANYIKGRRHRHPPIYQRGKGWDSLFGAALALAPLKLRGMAALGMIASGEVGELSADTYTTRHGCGYAVEMHSGMMRLTYSAARALAANSSGQFDDRQSPGLSKSHVAEQITQLFNIYRDTGRATAQAFPITTEQKRQANVITVGAEQFFLLHEFAHIHNGDLAFYRGPFWREKGPQAKEVAADAAARRWLFDYLLHPTPGGIQRQVFYAGAEFGLRVRMAMEIVGIPFSDTHPPAGDRVAAMRKHLREVVGTRKFYELANIAIANDQMWRLVEAKLRDPPGEEIEFELDDILAGVRTLVIEWLRSDFESNQNRDQKPREQPADAGSPNETQQGIFATAARVYRDIPEELRMTATERARDVFEPGTLEHRLFQILLNPTRQ